MVDLATPAEPIAIRCADGVVLGGHLWSARGRERGTIIINPATGVLARYYHYYARWLATQGYAVVTYDYRGIGLSRPASLRGSAILWRDWGERDFEAVVALTRARDPAGFLGVVGHSIGGFLVGFAPSAPRIDRILTIGAQYAFWRDYAAGRRISLFLRWHVVMPILTVAFGYFPGRRLGWLEDLPAGVAYEWSFRRGRMEQSYPAAERPGLLARFAMVDAPILAVSTTDDDFGTPAAISRTLSYYTRSERRLVMLSPRMLEQQKIGHFALFHSRFQDTFWPASLRWLRDGDCPWSDQAVVMPATRPLRKN